MNSPTDDTAWPHAALFDLDGTLMDREPLMVEAVARALEASGGPLADHDLGTSVGRAWTDVYSLLDIDGRFGWTFDEFISRVFDESEKLLADGFPTRVLEGGLELMELLLQHDVTVAVVTGSLRREVGPALEVVGVTDHVSLILAAEDYLHGKPDPECYLLAARQLGVEPSKCIVFEDSVHGVAAGRAAGMKVIATADANAPVGDPAHQDLSAAHVIVPRLSDVSVDHLLVPIK